MGGGRPVKNNVTKGEFEMKKYIAQIMVIAVLTLIISGSCFAAATVTKTGRIVEITAIDADWLWSTTFPNDQQIKVVSIEFFGGSANDIIVIKDGSDTGAILMKRKIPDTDYSSTKYFMGARLRPVIDFSDCTLSSGHKVIITLAE
jgi:hypothetical protein